MLPCKSLEDAAGLDPAQRISQGVETLPGDELFDQGGKMPGLLQRDFRNTRWRSPAQQGLPAAEIEPCRILQLDDQAGPQLGRMGKQNGRGLAG